MIDLALKKRACIFICMVIFNAQSAFLSDSMRKDLIHRATFRWTSLRRMHWKDSPQTFCMVWSKSFLGYLFHINLANVWRGGGGGGGYVNEVCIERRSSLHFMTKPREKGFPNVIMKLHANILIWYEIWWIEKRINLIPCRFFNGLDCVDTERIRILNCGLNLIYNFRNYGCKTASDKISESDRKKLYFMNYKFSHGQCSLKGDNREQSWDRFSAFSLYYNPRTD